MPKNSQNKQNEVSTSSNKGGNLPDGKKDKVSTSDKSNKNKLYDDSKIWITVKEGRNLLNITSQALRKHCREDKYETKTVIANGGKQYRIDLSSLPKEAQKRYWINQTAEERKKDLDRVDHISGKKREEALAKYQLVKKYNNFVLNSNYDSKVKAKKAFAEKYKNGEIAQSQHEIVGDKSYKSLERYDKKLRDNDFDPFCLAPKYGNNKGRTKVSLQVRKILLNCFLKPNQPKITEAIRATRKVLNEKGIDCDASDMTLRRCIDRYKKNNYATFVMLRRGEHALNNEAMPYIKRDYSKIEVGDVVVADGHVLNFDIINPWTGKPKRMTIVMFMDMKSNIPLGWDIMPTENTQVIASAFRNTVMQLSFVPRVVYMDNGKAFKANYFQGHDLENMAGLFERIGTQVITAQPYHAQSKNIERLFGTFGELERRLPSYRGFDIDSKPPRLKRGEEIHRAIWQEQGHTPTLPEAYMMIELWIQEYVTRKTTKNSHLNGKRPIKVYSESMKDVRKQEDFKSRQITPERLNFLMMERKQRTIRRNGIKMFNRWYYNEKMFVLGKGEKVNVRYDLHDLENVLLFKDDQFLCEANRADKVHPAAEYLGDDEDVEELQSQIAMKRRLKRGNKEKKQEYVENNVDDYVPSTPDVPEEEKEDVNLLLGDDREDEDKEEDNVNENADGLLGLSEGLETEEESEQDDLIMWESDRPKNGGSQ